MFKRHFYLFGQYFTGIFAIAVLAVSQPGLNLLATYPEFLSAHQARPIDLIITIFVVGFAVPFMFGLSALPLLLLKSRSRLVAPSLTIGLLIYLLCYPPLSRVPKLPDTGAVLLCIFVCLLFLFSYLKTPKFRACMCWLSICAFVFPLHFVFMTPAKNFLFPRQPREVIVPELQSKNPPNITLLLLDEIALPYLLNSLDHIDERCFPNFSRLAASSTWFVNSSTVAHNTSTVIPALLQGKAPASVKMGEPVDYSLPNLFSLLAPYYEMNVLESYSDFWANDKQSITNTASSARIALFLDDLMIAYTNQVVPKSFRHHITPVHQNWKNFRGINRTKGIWGLWQDPVYLFSRFLSAVGTRGKPQLNFAHLMVPHPPVHFNPSGSSYKLDLKMTITPERWEKGVIDVRVHFQRYLLQLKFADKLLGQLLEELEKKNLYDESLLIVTSDHGVSYRTGDFRRGATGTTACDIFSIPLFIKRPHQKVAAISEVNSTTLDILPTVLAEIGHPLSKMLDGYPLFAPDFPDRPQKKLLGHSLITASLPEFRHLKQRCLKNKQDVFVDGPALFPDFFYFRHHAALLDRFLGRPPADFSISKTKKIKVSLGQIPSLFADVQPDSGFVPTYIHGRAIAPKPITMAIAVNDSIVSFADLEEAADGSYKFQAMIPEAALVTGANTLTIYAIDEETNELLMPEYTKKSLIETKQAESREIL